MNRYRCEECGCYLDPGEGRLCEECREMLERQEDALSRKRTAVERSWKDGGGKASA